MKQLILLQKLRIVLEVNGMNRMGRRKFQALERIPLLLASANQVITFYQNIRAAASEISVKWAAELKEVQVKYRAQDLTILQELISRLMEDTPLPKCRIAWLENSQFPIEDQSLKIMKIQVQVTTGCQVNLVNIHQNEHSYSKIKIRHYLRSKKPQKQNRLVHEKNDLIRFYCHIIILFVDIDDN